VRALGNDVVHEPWRRVDLAEVDQAMKYTQRVIEDFYETRPSVLLVLQEKDRTVDEGAIQMDDGPSNEDNG
jgi:hypothetical protein